MGIKLRHWEYSDCDSLAKYANNKKIFDNLRDGFPHPYTINDAQNFIKNTKNTSTAILFAIECNEIAIGSIGAFFKDDVYRKNAEIGYWLAEPFWNKGIITESIKSITKIVFDNYDIERIYAEPFAFNTGSRKALLNSGFKHETTLRKNVFKNNQFFDSCIYSILKEEYQNTI